MNRTRRASIFTGVGMSFILTVPGPALAIDWNFTGFVRQEIAVSITNDENQFNASTKPNITKAVPTQTFGAYNPGATTTSTVGNAALGFDPTRAANELGIFNSPAFAPIGPGGALMPVQSGAPATCNFFAGTNAFGFTENPDTLTNFITAIGGGSPCGPPGGITTAGGADFADDGNNFNLFNTRAEFDIQANNITKRIDAFAKLRVYFDGTSNFNDQLVGDHFNEQFYGNRGNLLEVNSNDILIDIPALYFDYNKGPLWIRVGQQQIAWGEALFFRVFDVANGLDLRRHFFLDVAGEEFADERIASPGIRVSYTFSNGIEFDGFVQMFSPTLLPSQNGPFNIVTQAFHWDNEMELDEAQNTLNYGLRALWPITDNLTVKAMAVNRRNPNGVVRWHDAPATLPGGRPNPFCSGRTLAQRVSDLGQSAFIPTVTPIGADFSALFGSPFGGLMGLSAADIAILDTPTGGLARTKYTENGCGSFFAPNALGVESAQTWFQQSADSRFDPVALTAAGIDLAQVSRIEVRQGFGLPSEASAAAIARFGSERAAGVNTLDTFFTNFGPLSSWITREFKRESIFGFGGNYIFNMDEKTSFFDQLVLRGEMSYTPNKRFTNTQLSADWIEEDEWTASIVAEKYHRWSEAIPAVFLLAQWMFKSESDLFGRHLSLNETNPSTDLTCGAKCSHNHPEGSDSFNAVVFSFQQPFPNLVWRLDSTILIDVEGGWFFQPGVRYRPSSHFQFDIYANIAQAGGNKGDDIIETFDFADEVFVRATYFF